MTAADQPTTEPSATGLRIEHGWLVEETTGCTCAGGTEESSYLHEPRCGLTPLQRLDNLPGWPAPQPAADTERTVRDAIYHQLEKVADRYSDEAARHRADSIAHTTLRGTRSHMATAQAYRNKAEATYDAARTARGETTP